MHKNFQSARLRDICYMADSLDADRMVADEAPSGQSLQRKASFTGRAEDPARSSATYLAE